MKFEIDNPKKTALLIIDMENDFVKPDASMWVPMATEIVPNKKFSYDKQRKRVNNNLYNSCTSKRPKRYGTDVRFLVSNRSTISFSR